MKVAQSCSTLWKGTVLVLVVKYLRIVKFKKSGFYSSNVEFLSVVWISKSGLEFVKEIFDKAFYTTSNNIILEKEMATHSSILAWRILWTEEPGGLLSMGSHRVGHDWSDLACMHGLEKEMATHSSILAWRIPGMEEPGGLPSMASHRVRHDWSDLAAAAAIISWLGNTRETMGKPILEKGRDLRTDKVYKLWLALGWPKNYFVLFCNIVLKNPKEPFGPPNEMDKVWTWKCWNLSVMSTQVSPTWVSLSCTYNSDTFSLP